MFRHLITVAVLGVVALAMPVVARAEADSDLALRGEATAAMLRAATYFHDKVASHGGYVYYYSPDLSQRWGEGRAGADQVWVQPPATPAVGMAYLTAHEATGDSFYLDAAIEAANALVFGQLESGGWRDQINFDPAGRGVALYRHGQGHGLNHSSLDDGQTQAALLLLMHVDHALNFENESIHEATLYGLKALLAAQYPNGAFPQGWSFRSRRDKPVMAATYPPYDWRTVGRHEHYWYMYTLNDGVVRYVADVLIEAYRIYNDEAYRAALIKLGDFLILAQMPDPQPAWAQQYNFDMHPAWARKFEPPAITGSESQDAIDVLMRVYEQTNDRKYLEPVPRALTYLRRLQLPDGRMARYYELHTDQPLYMTREYELTYDDTDTPTHYGWKMPSRLDRLETTYQRLIDGAPVPDNAGNAETLASRVRQIINELDDEGRWLTVHGNQGRILGNIRFEPTDQYISSGVFNENLETISAYLSATK